MVALRIPYKKPGRGRAGRAALLLALALLALGSAHDRTAHAAIDPRIGKTPGTSITPGADPLPPGTPPNITPQPPGASDPVPTPGESGASCNFEEFKQSMKATESCGGTPTVVNCLSFGYAGLYQFSPIALKEIGEFNYEGDQSWNGVWEDETLKAEARTVTPTQRKCPPGGTCAQGTKALVNKNVQAFLNHPEIQERIADKHFAHVRELIKPCEDFATQGLTVRGRNYHKGKQWEDCPVTISGMVACGHISNPYSVCQQIRSGVTKKESGSTNTSNLSIASSITV